MKRIVVFALVLNTAFLGVIAHQLVAIAGGGAVPTTDQNGDVNGDQRLDMSDAVYLLIHYERLSARGGLVCLVSRGQGRP